MRRPFLEILALSLLAARAARTGSNLQPGFSGRIDSPGRHNSSSYPGPSGRDSSANRGPSNASKGMAAMNLGAHEPEEDSSSSFMMPSLTQRPKVGAAASGSYQNGSATTGLFPRAPQAPAPSRPSEFGFTSRPRQHPSPQFTLQPASWAPAATRARHAPGAGADLLVEEEVQVEDDGGLPEAVGMPGRRAAAPGVAALTAAGQPLSPDAARALGALLWGSPNGLPPDTWKQGFFFCHKPGLQFGLVQVSPAERSAALEGALADILWQARTKSSATLAVPAPERGLDPRALGYPQLMRSLVSVQATSKPALQEQLRSCLPYFMDAAGEAASNVFDGIRDLEGQKLRGIQRRSRVGFLSLFEWYKYMEVGSRLKNPEMPIWVVCAESHFTVLFAQDSRPLQKMLPFDLIYYDELANQDEPITLTVLEDPEGGWTARVGDSFGDRGRCEGQNIPPLECVIETLWPGVRVNWNGAEPIL
ncbi:hypothetical protein DUNSADRAFT_12134 [Dunaliella salina]|uniref:Deubiquitinating enzyme MINDY-3/4 conserved domain-containing protein n=1 Tax=Dunaliella salina TaxID=3046 RepID=A0ABQ7GC67_DUNSA|nr:hypothetical protein DUNSADRAFT_12134 [Dunaliella salina]|eukprot:KAF5832123.1 hypothetical protein DUNSADRAFT_12134 [Dunaliella salina]